MSDVFVSYKRADRDRVEPICECLRQAGLSVWWDTELEGGEAWRERIEAELREARCVLVVWSQISVAASFVRDEAAYGAEREVLLPVRIDRVRPPIGFGEYQTLELVGWNGQSASDARIVDVVETTKAIARGTVRPKLHWPRRRRWVMALSALSGPVAALLLVVLVPSLRHSLCQLLGAEWLCRDEQCTRSVERSQTLPVYVRMSEAGQVSAEAARQAALEQGRREAALVCGGSRASYGVCRRRSSRRPPRSGTAWSTAPSTAADSTVKSCARRKSAWS
jgi:hypothetical protein